MTSLVLAAMAYFTGLACLLVLDLADWVHLEPMARAVWAVLRPPPYTGRHRTEGLSTMQLVDEARAARAALREDTQSLFLPVFVDEAPLCPPTYPEYDHTAGVNRYVYLKPHVLAAQASMARTAARLRDRVPA